MSNNTPHLPDPDSILNIEPEFVTANFLAKRWAVTPATVYNWAKTETIPFIKVGATIRFPLAKVLEAVEGADSMRQPKAA